MSVSPQRRPVRAAIALAGAGSLGTFLAGALREIVTAIRHHNEAISDPKVLPDDPRILHPRWGRVSIDAVGGSSAGALCSGQLVKCLFEPHYLGMDKEIDAEGTITGDWIEHGAFDRLAPTGNEPLRSGPIESPGWTLLSASKLYDVAMEALTPEKYDISALRTTPASPLPANGIVGVGITLTDVLGYHEYADFDACNVLGHPEFGAAEPQAARFRPFEGREVRDLGVRQHSEVRRLFIGTTPESKQVIQRFLDHTQRRGKATGYTWNEAGTRLSALAAASAALPLALGPMAMTDPTERKRSTVRRLYMDGGVLNNKPISPALTMARWQDEIRILSRTPFHADLYDRGVVDRELDYERVCFFIDAFPNRTRGEWRSPHPDEALTGVPVRQMTSKNIEARDRRIDEALSTPAKGLGMFMESMLTSLRAQDIRGVAETNFRVAKRAEYIRSLVGRAHHGSPQFQLTDFGSANAYAAVREATRDLDVPEDEVLALSDLMYQADGFARMRGRRAVTMIPVFAPENLVEVLAGDAVYAVGGLLAKEARIHDAKAGQLVAKNVLRSLSPLRERTLEKLPKPGIDARPRDSSLLVQRLRVAAEAAIQGDGSGSSFVRSLVAFPFHLNPLVRLLKTRLDRTIQGMPVDDEEGDN